MAPARHETLDLVADWMRDLRGLARDIKAHDRVRLASGLIVLSAGAAAALAFGAFALGWLLQQLLAPAGDALTRAGRSGYDQLAQPLIVEPLTRWFQAHATPLPVDPLIPLATWLATGCLLYALACTRSTQAKALWPLFGAATAWCAHSGADPAVAPLAAGAVGVVWLVVSLIPYARPRAPRIVTAPHSETAWPRLERHRALYDAARTANTPHDVETAARDQLAATVAELAPPNWATRMELAANWARQRRREGSAGAALLALTTYLGGWLLVGAAGHLFFVAVATVGLLGLIAVVVTADLDDDEFEQTGHRSAA
ncbi:hypothetical protein [Amycolatopsis arida]|uniref:hypothetical protein n=1 Tax=Amycolatopsis arida TaxID=587909 RepID=UPI00106655D3|nr:hypothetical protein [Amycolatopsis arida]TDX84970.1 hypothetical protein CLV69_11754 [Amycolatopsis arida]